MPKQGSIPASTKALYSAGDAALYTVTFLFALCLVAQERWRFFSVPDFALCLLALLSLLASTALWIRRPSGGAMLATFLPALPLAAGVLALEGEARGAAAFTATALAFQLRCLLLAFADQRQRRRELRADALLSRLPETATVFVDNDIESDVNVDALKDGHTFRVAPGQLVPADGTVIFGSGFVNESFFPDEGENLRMKGMGMQVFAGTLNKNGNLLVRAAAVGAHTFCARLAKRMRAGTETSPLRLLLIDGVFAVLAAACLSVSGPSAALQIFLVASGASILAVLAAFEHGLAEVAGARRWLWRPGGIRRLAEAGMLVLRAEGVLNEGRPKFVALESASKLSEDAVLGLMAPLARKLETPAAFAVLQELRQRNIPLQPAELYQPRSDGGSAFVAEDEVRWKALPLAPEENFGPLEAFVREHLAAGDELHFLERNGQLEAALAFRDSPVPNAAPSVDELRELSLPVLLVSPLPKKVIDRLRTELGLEHAQGETSEAETELLMSRLTSEGLSPCWVQTAAFRPRQCGGVISLPLPGEEADLTALQLSLPALAEGMTYARRCHRRLRCSIFWVFGAQAGLLLTLVGADSRYAALLQIGNGWQFSAGALALAGILPGMLALAWSSPACPARTKADEAKLEAENV